MSGLEGEKTPQAESGSGRALVAFQDSCMIGCMIRKSPCFWRKVAPLSMEGSWDLVSQNSAQKDALPDTDWWRRHEPKSEQRGTARLGNPSRYERGSQGDSGSEGWGDRTCSLPWRGCRLLLRHIWPLSYFCLSSLHLVVDWLPSVWEELRGGLLLSAHQYRETDWAPPFFCDAEGWKKLMKGAKCSLLWL